MPQTPMHITSGTLEFAVDVKVVVALDVVRTGIKVM